MKISSIVLGLSRGGAFVPRLQFTDEPVAIGYVEMYGGDAGGKVTATLELAATLNGPALVAVPLAIQGTGEIATSPKGRFPSAPSLPATTSSAPWSVSKGIP